MYVISDWHDAVFVNPGSTVTSPVSFSRDDTTMPSLPSVAGTTGSCRAVPSTTSSTEAESPVVPAAGVVDVMSSFRDGPADSRRRDRWARDS